VSDIMGPSEAFRQAMDYYSHTRNGREMLWAAGLTRTDDPCVYAWERMAWRWAGACFDLWLKRCLGGPRLRSLHAFG